MMARFELGRFTDGNVYASGWWSPRPGQKVGLWVDSGNLIVSQFPVNSEVAYTWPRAESNQAAAKLAWRHYERKTR